MRANPGCAKLRAVGTATSFPLKLLGFTVYVIWFMNIEIILACMVVGIVGHVSANDLDPFDEPVNFMRVARAVSEGM
jgi:hypothetical protein